MARLQSQPTPLTYVEELAMEQRIAGRGLYNQPCNITPVYSTVSMNTYKNIELDVTPLQSLVRKILPFVIEVDYLRVSETTYTDGRKIIDYPEIKLIVLPAHRAELYNEDIEDKVRAHIRNKLSPLLSSMYEIRTGFRLSIHFGAERSETILEYLNPNDTTN
jgi:hypothetical protein